MAFDFNYTSQVIEKQCIEVFQQQLEANPLATFNFTLFFIILTLSAIVLYINKEGKEIEIIKSVALSLILGLSVMMLVVSVLI